MLSLRPYGPAYDSGVRVCGKENTELEDIGDAIVGHAIRTGVELVYVPDDEEFDRIGRIAALLRFRADQNTAEKAAS